MRIEIEGLEEVMGEIHSGDLKAILRKIAEAAYDKQNMLNLIGECSVPSDSAEVIQADLNKLIELHRQPYRESDRPSAGSIKPQTGFYRDMRPRR